MNCEVACTTTFDIFHDMELDRPVTTRPATVRIRLHFCRWLLPVTKIDSEYISSKDSQKDHSRQSTVCIVHLRSYSSILAATAAGWKDRKKDDSFP